MREAVQTMSRRKVKSNCQSHYRRLLASSEIILEQFLGAQITSVSAFTDVHLYFYIFRGRARLHRLHPSINSGDN